MHNYSFKKILCFLNLHEITSNNNFNYDQKDKFNIFSLKFILFQTLSKLDKQYNFLLPDYVIGFQNSPYKYSREVSCIAKWNKEVLDR